jgi:Cache domain.
MRNLTVYQRFAMIIAALTIVLFAVSALQILVLRDATLDERRTTVRGFVEAATKILAHYEGEAKAGRIEPDKARQMAFAAISSMRWGEYSDYIGVYGTGSATRVSLTSMPIPNTSTSTAGTSRTRAASC